MIAIRAARADDSAAIAAIYAPHVSDGVVSFETVAPDAATIATRMAASGGRYPWIVASAGDGADAAVVGYAYATAFRERAAYRFVVETTIYVADASHGRGVGRTLYEALLDRCRAQGFTQAIGVIALPNDASVRLHEAVGFYRAGVFRDVGYKAAQWIDVGYWQCALAPSVVPPPEPKVEDMMTLS